MEYGLGEERIKTERDQQRFIVDFWPTGRCDMECPFCYGADVPSIVSTIRGPEHQNEKVVLYGVTPETAIITGGTAYRPEMTLQDMKKVVTKLKTIGVTTLTIAGGEPLIRKETSDLIQFAYNIGFEVYLSTNGTFLQNRYNQIKDYLSVVGLPLDGSTSNMNILMGRREYLYKNIKLILSYFRQNLPRHKVKIGTVVSKVNIDDIEGIGQLLYQLPELYHPDNWRLYQFESLKRGEENRQLYEISDAEFSEVMSKLRRKFPEAKINTRSNNDHMNAYFFVTPDGLLQTVDIKHRSIADLLRINTDDLSVLVSDYSETRKRAVENRDWLD